MTVLLLEYECCITSYVIYYIKRYVCSILKASNYLSLTHEANFALCENFFAVIDQETPFSLL